MLGTWQLSDRNEEPSGDLEASGELNARDSVGWELKLASSLTSDTHPPSMESQLQTGYHTIFGEVIGGTVVSLFEAIQVGQHSSSTGTGHSSKINEERWVCNWFAQGRQRVCPEDIVKVVRIDFDTIAEWAHARRRSDSSEPSMEWEQRRFTIPDQQIYSIERNGKKLSLVCGWSSLYDIRSFSATQEAYFELEGDIIIDEILTEWAYPIRQLLRFFTLNNIQITEITAYTDIEDGLPHNPITLHYSDIKRKQREREEATFFDMLATLGQIEAAGIDIGRLFQKWFDTYRENIVGIGYLMSSEEPHLYTETQIHFFCMALEAFHNQYIGGTRRESRQHKRTVGQVMNALLDTQLDAEEVEWVKKRLESGNGKGQLRKIKEVIDRSGSTGAWISDTWPNFDELVNTQRNQVSHPKKFKGSSGNSWTTMFAVQIGLRWILYHVYLLELGFGEYQISRMLHDCNKYNLDMISLLEYFNRQAGEATK